jgi:hypothetical protein
MPLIQFVLGSLVAPIAILRIAYAVSDGDPGVHIYAVIAVGLAVGAANFLLRPLAPSIHWSGILGYLVVMPAILFFTAIWIACSSYELCF